MTIHLRYFAVVAEIAGRSQEDLELAEQSSAGDALAAVRRRHPALATPGFEPLLAVNRRHARPAEILSAGDELAIFPPVSGG